MELLLAIKMKNISSILFIVLALGCNSLTDKSKDTFDKEFDETYKDELKELEQMEKSDEWKKVEPRGNELQCPCCDYFTLAERGGYDICPICFWEDDGGDLDNLDEHSGPNHITLREGRRNFEKFGACDSTMVKNVISQSLREKFKLEKRIAK